MQMDKVVSFNIVGERTGRTYSGSFTFKAMASQRDEFDADLRRRQILGPSPDGTPPAANLQMKAFILGQIYSRSIVAPDFWVQSSDGLDILDQNVVYEIYEAIVKIDEEFSNEIKEDSKKALEKLQKKDKKEKAQETTDKE